MSFYLHAFLLLFAVCLDPRVLSLSVEFQGNTTVVNYDLLYRGHKQPVMCKVDDFDSAYDGSLFRNGIRYEGAIRNTTAKNYTIDVTLANNGDFRDANWTCRVQTLKENEDDDTWEVISEATTFFAPPVMKHESDDRTETEGKKTSFHCEARFKGWPTGTVKWSSAKGDNFTGSEKYSLKDHDGIEGVELIIANLVEEDRGHYNCTISNDYGESTTANFLRVKDKLAALWPFLGIVAEVIILCTIICVFERRRKRGQEAESNSKTGGSGEAAPLAHVANQPGHEEEELRQRNPQT